MRPISGTRLEVIASRLEVIAIRSEAILGSDVGVKSISCCPAAVDQLNGFLHCRAHERILLTYASSLGLSPFFWGTKGLSLRDVKSIGKFVLEQIVCL